MEAEELLSSSDVLVLSPHLDDALFSVHTLIAHSRPEVWTVFAGAPDHAGPTGWDVQCGYDNSIDLVEQRRREDLRAFDGLGATLRHLPLLERAYTDTHRRADDLRTLRVELHQWLDGHSQGSPLICVPVGAGTQMSTGLIGWLRERLGRGNGSDESAVGAENAATQSEADRGRGGALAQAKALVRRGLHWDFQRRRAAAQRRGMLANEDHVVVRDTVAALTKGLRDVRLIAYEELPYLWGAPGDTAALQLAEMLDAEPIPLALPVDRDAKAACISAYSTQIRLMDPQHRRLETAGTLPDQERLWWIRPTASGVQTQP